MMPIAQPDESARDMDRAAVVEASSPRSVLRVGLVGAWLAVATILPLLRQQGAHSWQTIWAEDGRYVTDAHASSFFDPLFRGYAGYAQFVPRVVAAGTRILPVGTFDFYLAVTSTAIASLVAAFVYRSMGSWVPSKALRLLLSVFVVVGPTLGYENTANATNLNWILWFAAFSAVVSRLERPLDIFLRCTVVFLAVTSTPLALLFAPLALALVVWRRRRPDFLVLAAFGLAGLIQGLAILAADTPDPSPPSHVSELARLYVVRVAGPAVFGEGILADAWHRFGWWLGWAALAALTALFIACGRQAGGEARIFATVALAFSLLTYAVPVWLRGTSSIGITTEFFNQSGARYTVVPLLLIVSALVVLIGQGAWLQRLRDQRSPRVPRVALYALAAYTVIVLATSFFQTTPRSDGPLWWDSVTAAAQTCRETGVPIASAGISPPGWLLILPCSRFTGAER